jgi:hypothetical protein
VLFSVLLGDSDELHGNELVASSFEASDDFSNLHDEEENFEPKKKSHQTTC